MSYGFRAGGQARTRRQPKMDDDNIGTALRRSLAGDEPRRASSQRGSTPRSGLPAQLNQRMPVNLSNGEFEFTPEQIYAIGLQAVAAMRHGDGRPGFADGASPQQGWGAQALDWAKQNLSPLVGAGKTGYAVGTGINDMIHGDVRKGAGEIAAQVPGALSQFAPDLAKKVNPVIGAGQMGYSVGNGINDMMHGNVAKGAQEIAGQIPGAVSMFAPALSKPLNALMDAGKVGAGVGNGINDMLHGNVSQGAQEVVGQIPGAISTFAPALAAKAASMSKLGINPVNAAVGGIQGAIQGIQDTTNGYRDHLQNSLDVKNPWSSALLDAGNVMAHVGNAVTGGLAGKLESGLDSAFHGGHFMDGFREQSDREKFLAAQQARQGAGAQ